MTTSVNHTAHTPFPPFNQSISSKATGTITNISSNGPSTFTLYNGSSTSDTVLVDAVFMHAFSMPVSIPFTKGLHMKCSTPHSIVFSIT